MKNIRRNVIFSGVGYILPLLAALLTIPLMLKYFGVDQYGLYIICISLIGFMSFVDLGVGQAVIKYVAEYEATGQAHKVKPVLDIALLMYLGLGLLMVTALFVFSPALAGFLYESPQQAADASIALRITSLALFLSYINQFFLNVSRAYHRFDVPAVIHNAGNISGVVLTTLLLLAGYALHEVLWGYVFIQAIALCSGYLAGRKVLPAGVQFGMAFDLPIFRGMISFSAYTFVSNFVIALVTRADKLLIGGIIGTEAVTYYQIPYTIAQMANGIVNTLVVILFPRFSELSSLKVKTELLNLYRHATHVVFFISGLIAVMLIAAGGNFLSLWVSPEFADKTTLTLQIIALFSFFNANLSVAYWAAQGSGQARLIAFVLVLSGVAYGIGLFALGKLYSYNGVAVALFLSLLPFPLLFMWVAREIGHRLNEYLFGLVLTTLLGLVAVYALLWVNNLFGNALVSIVVNGVVGILAGLAFFAWFFKQKKSRETLTIQTDTAVTAQG